MDSTYLIMMIGLAYTASSISAQYHPRLGELDLPISDTNYHSPFTSYHLPPPPMHTTKKLKDKESELPIDKPEKKNITMIPTSNTVKHLVKRVTDKILGETQIIFHRSQANRKEREAAFPKVQRSLSKINPMLHKNQLRFPYGTAFKFNGELQHNFDRVYIVGKIPIPDFNAINALKRIDMAHQCDFILYHYKHIEVHWRDPHKLREFMDICQTGLPTIQLIKAREDNLRDQIERITQLDLIAVFPQLTSLLMDPSRDKRWISIIKAAVGGLIKFGVESLSGYLRGRRDRAMAQAINKMRDEQKIDRSRARGMFKKIKDEFTLYGQYNVEDLTNIVESISKLRNQTSFFQNILVDHADPTRFLKGGRAATRFQAGLQNFLWTMHEQHADLYELMLQELKEMLSAIETLSKGYIPIEWFPPSKLANLSTQAINAVKKTHPSYELAITQIHHYYDMKLVTFALDLEQKAFIVTFPIFVKDHTTKPLALYEIETVPVPVYDLNQEANSYTEVVIQKPYIALSEEFYIQLRIQELRMCKKIRQNYYCEELFMVKHKTKHSCESALFFDLPDNLIKAHCHFEFYYNKSVTPSVLDGGEMIILANMKENKRLICSDTHGLVVPIETGEYIMVNRSILCNCKIEADLSYILKQMGSCDSNVQHEVFVTINLPFFQRAEEAITKLKSEYDFSPPNPIYTISKKVDDTTHILFSDNHTQTQVLKHSQIISDWDKYKQTTQLATNKTVANIISTKAKPPVPFHLLQPPVRLQSQGNLALETYMQWLMDTEDSDENLFSEKEAESEDIPDTVLEKILSDNEMYIWLLSIVSALVNIGLVGVVSFLYLKYQKIRTLINGASVNYMALQNIPPTESAYVHTNVPISYATCIPPWIAIVCTLVTVIAAFVYLFKHLQRLMFGIRHSAYIHLYLFVSNDINYVPIKFKTMAGQIHKLTINRMLFNTHLTIEKLCGWDLMRINWTPTILYHNDEQITLPGAVAISIIDKYRVRSILESVDMQVHIMARQGNTWHALQPAPPPEYQNETYVAIRDRVAEISSGRASRSNSPIPTPRAIASPPTTSRSIFRQISLDEP